MFAIVVDEDLYRTAKDRKEVSEVLKSRELRGKLSENETVKVASFEGSRGWVPHCLREFAHAA